MPNKPRMRFLAMPSTHDMHNDVPLEPQKPVDKFASMLGTEFLECSFDRASCRLEVNESHRNALGGLHGGVIFSLADIAFAAACNAGDAPYVGLQAEIRYMRGTRDTLLTATATRMGGTRRIAHYQVIVRDRQATDVALFTGSAYRLQG